MNLQQLAASTAARLARLSGVDDVALGHVAAVIVEDLARQGLDPIEFARLLLEEATNLENDDVVDVALELATELGATINNGGA